VGRGAERGKKRGGENLCGTREEELFDAFDLAVLDFGLAFAGRLNAKCFEDHEGVTKGVSHSGCRDGENLAAGKVEVEGDEGFSGGVLGDVLEGQTGDCTLV